MKVYLVFDETRNRLVSIWAAKDKAKNTATELGVYHGVQEWDVKE